MICPLFLYVKISAKRWRFKNAKKKHALSCCFRESYDYSTFSIITHNKKISDGTFKRIYDDIKEDKHGYVVFDGKNDSYGNCRIRTGSGVATVPACPAQQD